MNKFKLLIMIILIMTSIICWSLNSWMSIWMIMEFNSTLFIIHISLNNIYLYNSPLMYFMINSMSASIFILFIHIETHFELSSCYYIPTLIIGVKLGLPPFHFWFIQLMNNLDWYSTFLLSTVQKIIPFSILSKFKMNDLMFMLTMLSGTISLILVFNQTKIKKIMGYSSINQLAWMIIILQLSYLAWSLYFFCYSSINFIIFFKFKQFMSISIIDLMKGNITIEIPILIASLSGIPPFYGFMLKWLMVLTTSKYMITFIMLILMFNSLLFLFYYFRLTINYLLKNKFYIKKMFKGLNHNIKTSNLILLLNITGLLFILIWWIN